MCQVLISMAVTERRRKPHADSKLFGFCPIWKSGNSSSSTQNLPHSSHGASERGGSTASNNTKSSLSCSKIVSSLAKIVSSLAKSLLPPPRRLRLDPSNCLFFPYEPGKQVKTAISLKNSSKSHVAFKFQTTVPKSCYMRPPGGILAPGESLIATVFRYVEHPEKNKKAMNQKSKIKFKIMSLKVKEGTEYTPELFDEQKNQVTVERILRVVYIDPGRPCAALEKLKRQLAESEAALDAHKKPPAEASPRVVGDGLVIDEWKERREKYLARQQVGAIASVRS